MVRLRCKDFKYGVLKVLFMFIFFECRTKYSKYWNLKHDNCTNSVRQMYPYGDDDKIGTTPWYFLRVFAYRVQVRLSSLSDLYEHGTRLLAVKQINTHFTKAFDLQLYVRYRGRHLRVFWIGVNWKIDVLRDILSAFWFDSWVNGYIDWLGIPAEFLMFFHIAQGI